MGPKKIPATGLKVVDQLTEGDIQDFLVPALGSGAIPKLQDYGFNGEAAAFFGITLDNTNLVVAQGDIYLVGSLYTDAVCSISAKQLWPDGPDSASINIDFKNLGIFQFRGSLVSDFLPLEALDHEFLIRGDTVDHDVFGAATGGGEACVRAFLFPESSEYLRLEIRIFPRSKSSLLELFPHQQNHGIPGMKLASETVRFIPNLSHKLKRWGFPMYPFILKGGDLPIPASMAVEFRRCMHLTLSKGVKSVGASNAASLAEKLDALQSKTETSTGLVPFSWPIPAEFLAPTPMENQGKSSCLFCFLSDYSILRGDHQKINLYLWHK